MRTTNYLPVRSWGLFLLFLFCLLDLGYSSYQHYHSKLEGDIASIVVPKTEYLHVLADPFGKAAIIEGKRYAGANRFFAHYSMKLYFTEAPVFFSRFLGQVDALYWTTATFKTFVQLLLLFLLALYAHALLRLQFGSLLLLLAILTPFFQSMGYAHVLGIINPSITYVFFYSWPMALLLLFYYPFFRSWMRGEAPKIHLVGKIGLAGLLIYLPFCSPISGPVILLISLLYAISILRQFWRDRPTQREGIKNWLTEHLHPITLIFFAAISGVALYAVYLGQFNSENSISTLPLGQRYFRLLQGLGSMLTLKLGYPVLLGALVSSWLLLPKQAGAGAAAIRKLFTWALLFFVLYLLLLPLGGYRSYRPYIVRTDTMLPVICGLLVLYGTVAFYLLRSLSALRLKAYGLLLLVVAIIFTAADGTNFNQNAKEREGLQTLMKSQDKVVALPKDQLVLSWDPLEKPEESRWNAILLAQWGLTDTVRLYYNRRE